jgi:hypothetical protein
MANAELFMYGGLNIVLCIGNQSNVDSNLIDIYTITGNACGDISATSVHAVHACMTSALRPRSWCPILFECIICRAV